MAEKGEVCNGNCAIDSKPVMEWDFNIAAEPTPRGGRRPGHTNVEHFVECIDRSAVPAGHGDEWKRVKASLAGIGVTWPGAVSGELGLERVRSWSGILARFDGYCDPQRDEDCNTTAGQPQLDAHGEKPFSDTSAEEIHESFDVRRAFAEHFFPDTDPRDAPVTLINDGDAHIIHFLSQSGKTAASALTGQPSVVLAAGTGTAMSVIGVHGDSPADESPLDFLAEAGKLIIDIGQPLGGDWPLGTGRDSFSKATLSRLANEPLRVILGNANGDDELRKCFLNPLFIGYLLEDSAVEKLKIERHWIPTPAHDGRGISLKECVKSFRKQIANNEKKKINGGNGPGSHTEGEIAAIVDECCKEYADKVVRRVGRKLADLVALTNELFGTRLVHTTGGPMSGETGRLIHRYAMEELRKRYGFHVVDKASWSPDSPHRLARLMRLPLERTESDAYTGAHGAAVAAARLLEARSGKEA